jgi:isopenicillin-N epimerase
MPVERIVPLVKSKGIDILVDGAHAPGQIAIDLHALRPTYYAASCHKWLGASKGTGFLYADPERQKRIKPVAMSCRTHLSRPERKAFLCDFDYVGTEDPTGNLVLPVAIAHLSAQHPEGLAGLQRRNHETVLAGARLIADAAGVEQPVPESMIASMVSLCLTVPQTGVPKGRLFDDALWDALVLDHRVQAPCWGLAGVHPRLLRVSCQWHNRMADFERLAEAIAILMPQHGGAAPR